jgi:predicted DNA-binding transcriptional regulator AlpA
MNTLIAPRYRCAHSGRLTMALVQKFYTSKEVASVLGLEESTFKKMVAMGQLPQAIPMSKRIKMWTMEDINTMAWLLQHADRLRKSTADEQENDLD